MNRNTFKSIGAILAGFIVNIALSVGTDYIFEAIGFFVAPVPGKIVMTSKMLVVAFVYRCIYTIICGYVTAALAPNRPMRHVRILASIGVLISILGIFVGWNLSDHWYPIALAVIAYPLTWLGGRMRKEA